MDIRYTRKEPGVSSACAFEIPRNRSAYIHQVTKQGSKLIHALVKDSFGAYTPYVSKFYEDSYLSTACLLTIANTSRNSAQLIYRIPGSLIPIILTLRVRPYDKTRENATPSAWKGSWSSPAVQRQDMFLNVTEQVTDEQQSRGQGAIIACQINNYGWVAFRTQFIRSN